MSSTSTEAIKPLSEAGLSEKDLKNIAAAWLSCPAGDNLDMEKFAILAGYSTVVNARKRFGEVKKRVRTQVFGAVHGKSGSPKDECEDGMSGDSAKTTPKKSPSGGTKRKSNTSAGKSGQATKKSKSANNAVIKESTLEKDANEATQASVSSGDDVVDA